METRGNYVLVGALALAAVLGAFGFAFWIAGPLTSARTALYEIVFPGSVDGLARGSAVAFKGLKVGEVKELEIDPESGDRIIARIAIDPSTPIKSNTKVRIEFRGINSLTGVASIGLSGGDPNLPQLIGADGKLPTLIAGSMQTPNLLESAQNMTPQLNQLAITANRLTEENAENISAILQNTVKLTSLLAKNSDNIQDLLVSMGDLSKTIKPLTGKLTTVLDHTDNLLVAVPPERVKESVDRMTSILRATDKAFNSGPSNGLLIQLAETLHSVKRLSDNVDVTLRDLNQSLARFTGPGIPQLTALLVDARATLEEARRLLQSIGKDPTQVIFGKKATLPEYRGP